MLNKRTLQGLIASAFLVLTQLAIAANPEQTIREAFKKARPDLAIAEVKKAPATGLYEVRLAVGDTLYATPDGKHFVFGDLFALGSPGLTNITERSRDKLRKQELAAVNTEDMIVFTPVDRKVKASVVVFTDVDCGYCRKLHQEVPEMNKLGIEIRYMAFPRAGVGSPSFDKIATAWCVDDRQDTLTRLKNREKVDVVRCESPVADQYALGQKLGVRGTPAMITESGKMLPGYLPAAALAAKLGIN